MINDLVCNAESFPWRSAAAGSGSAGNINSPPLVCNVLCSPALPQLPGQALQAI